MKKIEDYTADELSAKIEAIKAERERTAKKYGLSVRDITANLFNAKRAMKKELCYYLDL